MTDAVETIRGAPGRFLPGGERLPHLLVLDLVALSTMESALRGFSIPIRVGIDDEAFMWVMDGGRGMRFEPDPGDGVEHVERAMTSFFPVRIEHSEVMEALTTWLWEGRGSLGPVVPCALSKHLQVISTRAEGTRSQRFFRGVPQGPSVARGRGLPETGTLIRLEADPEMFVESDPDPLAIQGAIDELCTRLPDLDLRWSDDPAPISGD